MRRLFLLGIAFLAGCQPAPPATVQNVAMPKARFAQYPDSLLGAFRSACSEPAQSFNRLDANTVECREFLPPEATAALILNFDGTHEELPELVIRFRTQAAETGYLVENDVFIHVPRRNGPALNVRRNDPHLKRTLGQLYTYSGGVLEQSAPRSGG